MSWEREHPVTARLLARQRCPVCDAPGVQAPRCSECKTALRFDAYVGMVVAEPRPPTPGGEGKV